MTTLLPGRHTVGSDRDVTVFLIGMRINSPLRVDRWWPVMQAFPPMLQHLSQRPDAGLLAHELWFGRTTISVQYWESTDKLLAFAADQDQPHLQPWRDFHRLAREGHVAVWHETYQSTPGQHEAIYINMPEFGLGKALGTVPVDGSLATARRRMASTGRS